MANSFKNYILQNAGTSAQNVYAVGAGTQSTVIGMTIANTTDSPITANVTLTHSGTTIFMLKKATIAPGGALVPVGGDQNWLWKQLIIFKFRQVQQVLLM